MIQKSDADRITNNLTIITGLPLKNKLGKSDGYPFIKFHTVDPDSPRGFSICIHFFWKRIEIIFIPDTFSKSLIESMAQNSEGNQLFSLLAMQINENSGDIQFEINKKVADPFKPESWEKRWTNIKLKSEKKFDGINTDDLSQSEEFVTHWVGHFLTMILALLPYEEEIENFEIQGLPEGAKTQIWVNRYERRPVNRTACISAHGCYCHICGFRFDSRYGIIGNGFIEVHHLTPVSKIDENYIINPLNDLIPVCSNCHSILHKRDPPLFPEELRSFLK